MSDMMQRPPQGMPQGGGMPPGGPQGNPMQKMSMFNPMDAAYKTQRGEVRPDMTIEEFLNKNFGVSARDPLAKLIEATKGQMQNSTMAGKMGAPPAGRPQAPPQAPMPQQGAQAMPQGRPPARGLDDLVNRMG